MLDCASIRMTGQGQWALKTKSDMAMIDKLNSSLPAAEYSLPRCCAPRRSALAQNVVVMVNGEPITAYDVEQRSKFLTLSNHKAPTHQEVLDELIDESSRSGRQALGHRDSGLRS